MRFFITGASGLVGGNCLRYLREQGIVVIGTHFSFATLETHFFDTLNMENPENYAVKDFHPTHIIHAGALTHVDYCEENPDESYKQTVISAQNMAKLAKAFSATLIYVSTDYVFDGENGPYDEEAKVNPISVYGKHKLEAEKAVEQVEDHLVVRITNVYGDEVRGKNFVARLLSAAKNKEKLHWKLPVDQYATPINAWNVADAIYLLSKDKKKGIYHLAGTDYLNRVQLAYKILQNFEGHNFTFEALKTSELDQAAPRPLQGGLKTKKFSSEYPEFILGSVDNYLINKLQQG